MNKTLLNKHKIALHKQHFSIQSSFSKTHFRFRSDLQNPEKIKSNQMGEEAKDEEIHSPLLPKTEHSVPNKTGTVGSAVAHIITAVIGSGVLSLSWSVAQLGWVAGPAAIVLFAAVTLVAAFLLCESYLFPDPHLGPNRNRSYLQAVNDNLGKKTGRVCGILVNICLYGAGVTYTITSATSMRAIQKSNCYHKEGHDAECSYGETSFMLFFGALQILLSQANGFHNLRWLSVVAALMSFTYSFIGFGLGLATTIENGYAKGSIIGIATSTPAEKVWLVAQGLGDIAFSYPFSLILLDIQDTLKAPPSENQTMKKASTIAITVTTFFYLCCGCFGYAAFGDDTPGNLLTGFGFYEPFWLIDFANACIVVHLLGGYQVYYQPMFASIEGLLSEKYPESRIISTNYTLKFPMIRPFRLRLLRLCTRTVCVVSATGIAMMFPYFNQVIGVMGALSFWPLTIYFPVEIYLLQRNVQPWTTKWIAIRIFSIACLLVTAFAFIGSVQGLVSIKFS